MLTPTPKQMAFARSLADRTRIPLPEGCEDDRRLVSSFITERLSDLARVREEERPTAKQKALARKLCRERGMGLPAGVDSSKAAMSRFLTRILSQQRRVH